MNLQVGGTFRARFPDVFAGHVLATLLHLRGNREQCFQLRAHRRIWIVETDGIDEFVIPAQVVGGGSAMADLTEVAVVPGRYEGGNHLALAAGQRTRPAEQRLGESA